MKKNIAIFASGTGTNAENIITYFNSGNVAEVVLVLSNSKTAAVLDKAKKHGVECCFFTKEELYASETVLQKLKNAGTDLIVLAGFLWKFPESILNEFPGKVINIHP